MPVKNSKFYCKIRISLLYLKYGFIVKKSVLFLFTLFLTVTGIVCPQINSQVRFSSITSENGLSNNSVWDIIMDSRGFMWFSTMDGLNRYDGIDFKLYRHDPNDTNSLSDSLIYSIYEDTEGYIWIGTWSGGLNRFDPRLEEFTRYIHDPENPQSMSDNSIKGIYEDRDGQIWIGTLNNGLNMFERETETFIRYTSDPEDPTTINGNGAYSIIEDMNGYLWVGGFRSGLSRLERKSGSFTTYSHNPDDAESLNTDHVYALSSDSNGLIWIGTIGGGLNKFDPVANIFTHYTHDPADPHSLSDNIIYDIFEGENNGLWIGTRRGGVNYFNKETEQFTSFMHDPADPFSISGNGITSLYEDNNGILWLGTRENGISILDNNMKDFHLLRNRPDIINSLSSNSVRAIFEDDLGYIWIGTLGGGISVYNRDTEQFTHYLHDPGNPDSLSSNEIYTIASDSNGNIWIGTSGGGVDRFEPETETFLHYRHDPNNANSLIHNSVQAIYEDSTGLFWFGTASQGLNSYDISTGLFKLYRNDPKDQDSISGNSIWAIYEDSDNRLWFGTPKGLDLWDRQKDSFVHYQSDPGDKNSLSHDTVQSIYEDSKGRFWVGTLGGGLNKFDREKEKFTYYREKDGLTNDVIYRILEDAQGNLWISTANGLSKFNPETEQFTNYDTRDGLQGKAFTWGAGFKDSRGVMYFGGPHGLTYFHPGDITLNTNVPPVVLTDFKIFNQHVQIGSESPLKNAIEFTEEITLSYTENSFSFEFAALNYTIPEKNRYRFKMDGVDKDWIQTDYTRRFANYTRLKPGNYVFRVQGSNNDGVWNSKGVVLNITIIPPMWRTWWAYVLYAFLIIAGILGYIRLRIRSLEAKRRKLEVKVLQRTKQLSESNERLEIAKEKADSANKAKSDFLSTMSHELRTPLNAILGFSELMEKETETFSDQREDLSIIRQSGKHLLSLINDVLDMSKIEAGETRLTEESFDMWSLQNLLEEMFELSAGDKGLVLNFSRSDTVPRYLKGDEKKIRQIYFNLISNAVKFTDSGSIAVSMEYIGEYNRLTTVVSDTGPGIPEKEMDLLFNAFSQTETGRNKNEGTGLGLSICKAYIEMMHGEISVNSKLGEGSSFSFHLILPEGDAVEVQQKEKEKIITGLVPGQGEYRILIVEDRYESRKLMEKMLAIPDILVKTAVNGKEGVELAASWNPHLIWMDIRMPVMDGIDATRHIRLLENGINIPIIAVTASIYEEDQLIIHKVGCTDVLRKPVSVSQVFRKMAEHLDIRYVYEETSGIPAKQKRIKVRHKDLSGLSGPLIDELENAVLRLDSSEIKKLIKQASPDNPQTTEVLVELADDYRYDEILNIINRLKVNEKR